MSSRPGARFTNSFSIAAVLSWHAQKFVAIWWPATELHQGEISIEIELRAKIVSETGPWSMSIMENFQEVPWNAEKSTKQGQFE